MYEGREDTGLITPRRDRVVRAVWQCEVVDKALKTLRDCACELDCLRLKLDSTQEGTCLVYNNKVWSVAELRAKFQDCRSKLDEAERAFLGHMESYHGTSRVYDSGYGNSQTGSQILNVDMGFPDTSNPNSSMQQPEAMASPQGDRLLLPIQETQGQQAQGEAARKYSL